MEMGFDVVDADERDAQALRDALRGIEPDDQRGRKTRTVGDGDGVDRVLRVFSVTRGLGPYWEPK